MIADRVMAGLGTGFQRNAGPLLAPLVEALVAPVSETDRLLEPTADGWLALFDGVQGNAHWLAQLAGIIPNPTLSADEQRAVIVNRARWSQGTYLALVTSIQATLDGAQRVRVDERDQGAWHATIHVYESDFAAGTTQELIRGIVERHRPVGMTFDVIFYPASSYEEAELTAGTYADAEATARTYQEVEE